MLNLWLHYHYLFRKDKESQTGYIAVVYNFFITKGPLSLSHGLMFSNILSTKKPTQTKQNKKNILKATIIFYVLINYSNI